MRLFYSGAFSELGSRNLTEVFMHMMRQQSPEIIRDFFTRNDPGGELRPLLPTLRVPTLVLHGEEDRLVPVEAGRYLADHIPEAQFYLFKGRGHIPMFTATTEFAQVIRNFIRTGRPT
jgi:pimeloyl-ACP methyl ester carboxylesterase